MYRDKNEGTLHYMLPNTPKKIATVQHRRVLESVTEEEETFAER